MNTNTSNAWTNNLNIDEVAPSEIEDLCNLINAILLDLVAVQVGQLRTERCCGCEVDHPSQKRHDCLMMTIDEGWTLHGQEAIERIYARNIVWKEFLEAIRVMKLNYHARASVHYTNLWKNYETTRPFNFSCISEKTPHISSTNPSLTISPTGSPNTNNKHVL
jgi:hypothetical protein